jgi:hypothetical protein
MNKRKTKNREVVINACFGGFSLSPVALLWLWARGVTSIGTTVHGYWGDGCDAEIERELAKWRDYLRSPPKEGRYSFITVFSPDEKFVLNGGSEMKRDDPLLIKVVRELGKKADGACAALRIVKIPADVEWAIHEYDGSEHVEEVHRTWS